MPRTTRIWSEIKVVGPIWQPGITAAQSITLRDYDITNMLARAEVETVDKLTRDDVETWLTMNTGDFSGITDFAADFDYNGYTLELPWLSEDGELAYFDAMFPAED